MNTKHIMKSAAQMAVLSGLLWLTAASAQAQAVTDGIPVREEVGALNMPETIAPIKAPFDMPQLTRPEFNAFTLSITETGAREGKMATRAIQKAIDRVNRKGGGTVIVPAGIWNTGRIELKSNVNLHLEEGAELHFSGNIKDYQPAVFTRNEGVELYSLGALVYANGQRNIALTGKGKLVGPAKDCEIQKRQMTGGVIETYINPDTPVKERVYDGKKGGAVFLPMFVSPINCQNVLVEGVTLESTPFWNVVPVYCDSVIIRGITVRSVGIPRGDGIDIESTRNVLIEYSTLSCGDDCFTMKAGRCEDGLRVNRPSENIVVRHCLAEKGHGGITCGSETAGMIRNLYVHDCVFDGTGTGLRFKTRRNRGGGGENLTYERIRMRLSGQPFVWDMLGSKTFVGELAVRLPAREITPLTPTYRNITARDIVVESGTQFIKAQGIPETPVSNVLIENVNACTDKLMLLQDVDGMTLRNVSIACPDSVVKMVDARGITFEGVHFAVPGGKPVIEAEGELNRQPAFVRCLMRSLNR